MKHLAKRSISFVLALVLCLSLLSGISFHASAATVQYQYASTSKYTNVIKNWGKRGELATFLSPNAEKFYNETTYEELAALQGSSDLEEVATSPLYLELYQLMSEAHTKKNSYEDTKNLLQYTDCQTNGSPSNKISAFYSGDEVGPAWDKGETWNREHTWPNSKGGASSSDGGGTNEVDIMMIRPETSRNNSSRGNKAYGESSGYYFPNLSEKYDVRGDAARTILYVYVRWGLEESEVLNNMWGEAGVMESRSVLLKWMEEDPVDTWEMGRNDSVESITGTRNVFVDYPELGFLLFNESVPADYQSPSNNSAVEHSYEIVVTPPTAESEGYTTYTCSICGYSYNDNFVPALGYDYTVSFSVPAGIGEVEDMIGNRTGITLPSAGAPDGYTFAGWTNQPLEETAEKPAVFTGKYIPTENTTLYALYTKKVISGSGSGDYEKVTSAPADWSGDYVIVYEDGKCVFNSTLSKLDAASNNVAVTITNNTIAASKAEAYKFTIKAVSGGYSIRSASGYYIGATGNSNSLNTSTSTAYVNTLSVNADGTVNVLSSGGAYLRFNSSSNNMRFRYYQSGTYDKQKAICLYKKSAGSTITYYATLTPASVASVNGVEYTSFEKAYANANPDSNGWCCVKLLADVSVSNLTLEHDLYIDMNGFDLELNIASIKNNALIYGLDSSTDSFDAADWGKLSLSGADVTVNPYAADLEGHRYVTAAEADGSWSFHGYLVQLVAVSLKPGADALGYKAQFFGDSVACSMVTDYGFHLTVENGETKTVTKEDALKNGQTFSLRLQGIMAANGGELYIDADAFVNFSNGATGMTFPHSTTMRQTLETIESDLEYDNNSYTAQQIAALQAYIQAFESKMIGWDIDTIRACAAA